MPRSREKPESTTVSTAVVIAEAAQAIREQLGRCLGPEQRVLTCYHGEEALDLIGGDESVALVLVDANLPDMGGHDFLCELYNRHPRVMGILLTDSSTLPARGPGAPAVARECNLFQSLAKPVVEEELRAAVDGALAAQRAAEDEREPSSRLRCARASLEGITDVLENSIAVQTTAMRRLHDLALELNSANTLQEIAEASARAAMELLQVSAALVRVRDPRHPQRAAEVLIGQWPRRAGDGSDVSSQASAEEKVHREELCSSDGNLGEILLRATSGSGNHAGALPPRERESLNLLASSTAIAVRNELRRHERDAAQQATILALAGISERRDNETGLHLKRLAAYCRQLAEGLVEAGHYGDYITSEFIDHLARSSPLHDIGKVAIPDSILLKPGKLTREEEAVMHTHTTIGAETLESAMQQGDAYDFLAMGRDIALCHHERWDGSGYPRGLSGGAIPLSARILSLADVYDALTTERRYKPAWDHERVVSWIGALSGRQFDPDIVAVFLARQDEFDASRAQLADVFVPRRETGAGTSLPPDSSLGVV